MSIALSARVTIPNRVLMRDVAGEAVLLNLNNEHYYGLDEVGARFLTVLVSSASIQAAIDALLAEYDIDRVTLERDMLDLLGKLAEQGLIEIHDG